MRACQQSVAFLIRSFVHCLTILFLVVCVLQNHDNDDKDIQQQIADNVNQRMEKAIAELQDRHRTGTNEVDHPDRAPTGPAYQMIRQQQEALRQAQRAEQQVTNAQQAQDAARLTQLQKQVASQLNAEQGDGDNDDDDGSDYDDLLDDPALDEIRNARLEQIKQAHVKKMQDLAKGHGQVRTISQDEFLPECTGSSEFVAVHFFHQEFQRCEIMDHHFKIIATQHVECKCLRIDADKAPFFVQKLQVRTLPTLIVFRDGKAVDRLTGFEGLAENSDRPDEWSTRRLKEWMAQTGAIHYTPSAEEVRQDLEKLGIAAKKRTIYSSRTYADGEGY